MGVILSRLATAHPETWAIITQVCRWLSLPALVMFVTTTFWPSQLFYLVGLTVIPLLWSIVLAAVAGSKPLPGASSRLIYGIAMTSYSVYLTHSLSIHAGAMLGNKIPQLPSSILLGVWLLLIFGIGSGFYIVVEKTSLWLREKISPAGEAGGTRVSEAGRPMVSEPVYGHGTGEFGKERVLTP